MSSSFDKGDFFPDRNSNVKPYDQCLEFSAKNNTPMFANDLNSNGTKSYMCCGYDQFVNTYYNKKQPKNMYEIIRENRPCRIFLDFDEKDVSKKDDFEMQCNTFITYMVDHPLKKYDPKVYILRASTENKCSMHVIIDLFLKDYLEVKNFVEYCLFKSPCPYVDRLIYTKNRAFRLLYSKKYDKPDASILTVEGKTEYDPDLVVQTLIQAYHPMKHKVRELEDLNVKSTTSVINTPSTKRRKIGEGGEIQSSCWRAGPY